MSSRSAGPVPGDTLLCLQSEPGLTAGQAYTLLPDGTVPHDDGVTRLPPADRMLLVAPAGAPAPGRYRHYKGGLYRVLCVGRHSETEEWLVTYWSEATRDAWVRPLAMWLERVDGTPRFVAVAER